jgi:hypothetical protein
VLLVVVTVAALQVAVTFMHPNTSNFVYAGASGHENEITPGALSTLNVTQVVTKVVSYGTTQTQTLVVTSPQTVTDSITLPPQAVPPDYTPVGIAIVVAVGMLALLAMFLKRRR